MAEKETTMRLMVDLQCEKCCKKVKKVLCKFPQIRDQVFDEKQNIVTIKVVCCSPETIRDKLCCKGCGAIESIEIVEPPPLTPPPPTPQPKPCKPEKPPCAEGRCGGPCHREPEKRQIRIPPTGPVPNRTCCAWCYERRHSGPCFEGCGGPPSCYGGYFYGRFVYDSYGGGRPCYVSRCDQYFSEENPNACTIT